MRKKRNLPGTRRVSLGTRHKSCHMSYIQKQRGSISVLRTRSGICYLSLSALLSSLLSSSRSLSLSLCLSLSPWPLHGDSCHCQRRVVRVLTYMSYSVHDSSIPPILSISIIPIPPIPIQYNIKQESMGPWLTTGDLPHPVCSSWRHSELAHTVTYICSVLVFFNTIEEVSFFWNTCTMQS